VEAVHIQLILRRHYILFRDERQERKVCKTKILTVLLVLTGISFSQKEEITIKYDTIIVPKTRILRIVKLRTLPRFILHLSGSYNSGAMELTGHNGGFNKDDFFSGKSFGARHGYGINLTGKLPLEKKGIYWLDFIAGFDHFQSDLIADNTEEGRVYYNSVNFGVGAEYNFTPAHKVKYFLGAVPLFSIISGEASSLPNQENNRVDVNIRSSVRLGYSVFIGLEYAFAPRFGFNMGLKFTHANLLLKNSEEPEQETEATSSMTLNDDSPDTEIQFAAWKQFAYFSANAGFSYFFGVKERRYKRP